MAIDRDVAMAHRFADIKSSYCEDDVIKYHLGIGAGARTDNLAELDWVYEKNLKVLPSFASVVPSGLGEALLEMPGLNYDRRKVLHGEQSIEIDRPLPTSAELIMRKRIVDIVDKGKAAVVLVEAEAVDQNNESYFRIRNSIFLRGEGGFGGPRGDAYDAPQCPDRSADLVVEIPTLPQQALLYRLCGDKNPLHCDPEVAQIMGFKQPILHGLCSYGIVCKAAVDSALEGNLNTISAYSTRFTGVVFPGETLCVKLWIESNLIFVEAETTTHGDRVIRGFLTLNSH